MAREFETLLASGGPLIQTLLEAVPALSGTLTVLAWAIWGLGAVMLVALAVGAHFLIARLTRSAKTPDTPNASALRHGSL